jgi:predicted nucleotidyltransferase component of viral defense system
MALKDPRMALKGGTAINLFIRDLPRLSVDIDLTYLPIEPRDATLANIDSILKTVASTIETQVRGTRVTSTRGFKSAPEQKLVVELGSTAIKVEVNSILRGSVFAPQKRDLSQAVQRRFGAFASVNVLSFEDLYAGKICAALDRQHPRDWFDIFLLLREEGITERIKQALLVYLISHNRPMSELLEPRWQDLRPAFEAEFKGMTTAPVALNALEQVREDLLAALRKSINDADKKFLIDFKSGVARWNEFFNPEAQTFPAIIWKQKNLEKMDGRKRKAAIDKLSNVFKLS